MPTKSAAFTRNVFINCPFDAAYTPLFKALVFAVRSLGFRVRCALEASNAGEFRLSKIQDIIAECRFAIHDLSRTELDAATALPRFNMPLELGLDLGCRRYGNTNQKKKVCLILDVEPFRYQRFISDIAGQDIYAHGGSEQKAIQVVRDWLRLQLDPQHVGTPSGSKLFQDYRRFQKNLPAFCAKLAWDPAELSFADFSFAVGAWVKENPL